MTFLELRRKIESLSPDELSQQVTIEIDGENTPLQLWNEGQGNVHFAYDLNTDLQPFFENH